MARLWTCGFELNSLTAGVEFDFIGGAQRIDTITVRSGTYSLKCGIAGADDANVFHQFASSVQNAAYYYREYIYITAAPDVQTDILGVTTTNSFQFRTEIQLNTNNTLRLSDNVNNVLIGSASFALSLNTWYRVELKVDSTTLSAVALDARIDGVSFATGTVDWSLSNGQAGVNFGVSDSLPNTCTFYLDDLAINDSTGSFQNSWPGDGSVVHLRPNGSGDSTQWTPDAGSNYARVNEITPNDVTSYVQDVTLNNSDLYKVDNLISVHKSITLVQVGVRFANDTADATTAFKVQAEKTASGTVSQSAAIVPNSITYKTNATAAPFNYPLTLHQDPDSINWTQDTINSLQIGVQTTAAGTNKNRVSTIWALVEYVPTSETNRFGNQYRYGRVGDGMGRSEGWT